VWDLANGYIRVSLRYCFFAYFVSADREPVAGGGYYSDQLSGILPANEQGLQTVGNAALAVADGAELIGDGVEEEDAISIVDDDREWVHDSQARDVNESFLRFFILVTILSKAICANMMSPTKPEIHDISQRWCSYRVCGAPGQKQSGAPVLGPGDWAHWARKQNAMQCYN